MKDRYPSKCNHTTNNCFTLTITKITRQAKTFTSISKAYVLILEGLVPSAPPTTDMLLILTSDVNLTTKFQNISIREVIQKVPQGNHKAVTYGIKRISSGSPSLLSKYP